MDGSTRGGLRWSSSSYLLENPCPVMAVEMTQNGVGGWGTCRPPIALVRLVVWKLEIGMTSRKENALASPRAEQKSQRQRRRRLRATPIRLSFFALAPVYNELALAVWQAGAPIPVDGRTDGQTDRRQGRGICPVRVPLRMISVWDLHLPWGAPEKTTPDGRGRRQTLHRVEVSNGIER